MRIKAHMIPYWPRGLRAWPGRRWDMVEFVRLLVPALADAGDEYFVRVREIVLGRSRDDLPRAAGLDATLREVLEQKTGARGPRSA